MENLIAGIIATTGITLFYTGMYCLVFVIFSFISILKLFPVAKYITPLVLGALFVFGSAVTTGTLASKISAFISTGLAIWYAIGGIAYARRLLKVVEDSEKTT